jgi:hypothetical protein
MGTSPALFAWGFLSSGVASPGEAGGVGLRQRRLDGRGPRLCADAKNVVSEIEKVWASEIKDASGKPIYTTTH